MRKPPRRGFWLFPSRVPGGSFFNFLIFHHPTRHIRPPERYLVSLLFLPPADATFPFPTVSSHAVQDSPRKFSFSHRLDAPVPSSMRRAARDMNQTGSN